MAIDIEQIDLPADQSFRLLQWDGDVERVRIAGPGRSMRQVQGAGARWHFHPEMELTWIARGSGTRFIGDHIENFQAPDLVLIGPNLPHCWTGMYGSAGYALQFDFGPTHPFWQFPETRAMQSLWAAARQGICFRGDVANRIAKQMQSMFRASGPRRLALLHEVLADLAESLDRHGRRLSRKVTDPGGPVEIRRSIDRTVRWIFEHFDQDLTLDQATRQARMSRATFCRHFRAQTGRTFIDFLNAVRIDQARRLLLDGSLSIGRVAIECGFGNLSHFNRQFHRRCGLSPRKFRRNPLPVSDGSLTGKSRHGARR